MRRKRWPWLPAAVVIAAAAVVFVVRLVSSSPHLTGAHFTMHGVLTVPKPDYVAHNDGSCAGTGTAAGVAGGDDIILADSSGSGLAKGTFVSGVVGPRGCRFAFTVRNVPAGPNEYVADIGDDVQLDVPAQPEVTLTWPTG